VLTWLGRADNHHNRYVGVAVFGIITVIITFIDILITIRIIATIIIVIIMRSQP